ncbi:phragmoplastin interacting protein 1 [Aristolochia californica]|uniref:phragmoplastin interacting protein 1 n=1 Tax=Aristolochia californica TaxID=171875 RepID=UPI0035E20A55
MVLSNKKLKQKVRAAVAESLTSTAASELFKDDSKDQLSLEAQSLKLTLSEARQKARTSKREKRKTLSLEGNSKLTEETENTQIDSKEGGLNATRNTQKKRKRDDADGKKGEKPEHTGGVGNAEEVENGTTLKNKKKGKKKKKKKKAKEGSKDDVGGDGDSNKSTQNESVNKNTRKRKKDNGEAGEKGIDDELATSKVVEEAAKSDASQENEAFGRKIYVGGIPYYSTEDDIRSFFDSCGTLTDVDCMKFPETGKFRGIAFLTFKTEAAAKRALALDGADMGGFFLKIQPYKATRTHGQSSDFAPEIIDGYNRIYAGNLSWDITEENLRKLFSDCNISSIRFGTDKTTGEFRGYAHIDFSDSVSLSMALKLDQSMVCGRPVKISCAVPKKQAESLSRSEDAVKQDEGDGSSKPKKKRRICYLCGVPGHLSSSCPEKQAAERGGTGSGEC